MDIKIIPHFTDAGISQSGFLNSEDLQKMGKNLVVFLLPAITLYATQLMGVLSHDMVLQLKSLWPSNYVIGSLESYVIAAVLDYLKKLNDSGN